MLIKIYTTEQQLRLFVELLTAQIATNPRAMGLDDEFQYIVETNTAKLFSAKYGSSDFFITVEVQKWTSRYEKDVNVTEPETYIETFEKSFNLIFAQKEEAE